MAQTLPKWFLEDRLALSLDEKISLSKKKIKVFYEVLGGQVYISSSGGIDSVAMTHLVRSEYPDVDIVHVATPRYPDTVRLINKTENVTILIPDKNISEVIEKYGYPVISKETSKNISRYRNTKHEYVRQYRKYGIKQDGTKGRVGVIPKKWHFMIDAPFKISDRCCDVMKKLPFTRYERKSGKRPYIGLLAEEDNRRKMTYLKTGCNSFKEGKEQSTPIMFWKKTDIWEYVRRYEIPYSEIYDKGETRTGCVFCCFGVHLEDEPNRFQRLKIQYPKLHKLYMETYGLREVLEYMGIPSE